MFYKIIKVLLKFVTFFLFRIKIAGKENIPKDGGMILAVNHKSNWDPIVAAVTCPRKLRFMAKAELFRGKLISGFLKAVGAFPIHRGKGDIGAIKSSLSILKNNEPLLIFPEGTRVKDECLTEAKPGAVMLAIRSEVPIVPAYISGKYRWLSRITITFGKPVFYNEYYGKKPVVEELQVLSNQLLKDMRSYNIEKEKNKKL